MQINLHEMEIMSLVLHLKDWLDEHSDWANSDDVIETGQFLVLENIYKKLNQKI